MIKKIEAVIFFFFYEWYMILQCSVCKKSRALRETRKTIKYTIILYAVTTTALIWLTLLKKSETRAYGTKQVHKYERTEESGFLTWCAISKYTNVESPVRQIHYWNPSTFFFFNIQVI